jgi:hypothetical protein
MTDFKHIEEQIAWLRKVPRHHVPLAYWEMCCEAADTMQALLDVARAAGRIYNRPIHNQSDEDRLRDDLAKLQEQSDET